MLTENERNCPNGMILGIDLGTSSVKTVGLREDGSILKAKASYRGDPPACWWTAISEALRSMEGLQDAAAVGLSSQVGTYLFRETEQGPYTVIPWSDGAGTEELAETLAGYDGSCFIREICMMHPHLISYPIPRIRYIRKHHPKAVRICQPKDFLMEKLTGNFVTDPYSWRGIANTEKQCYSAFFLNELGVKEGRELPVMCPVRYEEGLIRPSGRLTEKAAAETGLPAGIPVFCGMNDFYCALLGMGIVSAGDTFDITGTSEHFGRLEDHLSPDSAVISGPYLKGFVHYGVTGSGGASLDFVRRNFPGELKELEKITAEDLKAQENHREGNGLRRLADEAPVFLPYLNGERAPICDAGAEGVYFGIRAGTQRIHMAYAVLEGVVFSLVHIRSCMDGKMSDDTPDRLSSGQVSEQNVSEQNVSEQNVSERNVSEWNVSEQPVLTVEQPAIRVTGGAAVNPVLNLLKATALGHPVMTLRENDCSALGAAMIAWCGRNRKTPDEAVRRFVRSDRTYLPADDGSLKACLDRRFSVYRALYPALKPVFHMKPE